MTDYYRKMDDAAHNWVQRKEEERVAEALKRAAYDRHSRSLQALIWIFAGMGIVAGIVLIYLAVNQ